VFDQAVGLGWRLGGLAIEALWIAWLGVGQWRIVIKESDEVGGSC